MAYETRTGNSPQGICEHCGADKVLSPKTQKTFCSEKCWLKGEQAQPSSDMSQYLLVTQFNDTLDRMRSAFSLMDKRIKALELIVGAETADEIPIVEIKDDKWANRANEILGLE